MTTSSSQPSPRRSITGDVPSPCISVCTLLEPQGICAGCFRTLDEIAQWSVLDAAEKRAILAALPGRRAALFPPETSPPPRSDAER